MSGGDKPKPEKAKSRFRGVYQCGRKWKAQIQISGVQFYLGTFGSEEEARAAYEEKAREDKSKVFTERNQMSLHLKRKADQQVARHDELSNAAGSISGVDMNGLGFGVGNMGTLGGERMGMGSSAGLGGVNSGVGNGLGGAGMGNGLLGDPGRVFFPSSQHLTQQMVQDTAALEGALGFGNGVNSGAGAGAGAGVGLAMGLGPGPGSGVGTGAGLATGPGSNIDGGASMATATATATAAAAAAGGGLELIPIPGTMNGANAAHVRALWERHFRVTQRIIVLRTSSAQLAPSLLALQQQHALEEEETEEEGGEEAEAGDDTAGEEQDKGHNEVEEEETQEQDDGKGSGKRRMLSEPSGKSGPAYRARSLDDDDGAEITGELKHQLGEASKGGLGSGSSNGRSNISNSSGPANGASRGTSRSSSVSSHAQATNGDPGASLPPSPSAVAGSGATSSPSHLHSIRAEEEHYLFLLRSIEDEMALLTVVRDHLERALAGFMEPSLSAPGLGVGRLSAAGSSSNGNSSGGKQGDIVGLGNTDTNGATSSHSHASGANATGVVMAPGMGLVAGVATQPMFDPLNGPGSGSSSGRARNLSALSPNVQHVGSPPAFRGSGFALSSLSSQPPIQTQSSVLSQAQIQCALKSALPPPQHAAYGAGVGAGIGPRDTSRSTALSGTNLGSGTAAALPSTGTHSGAGLSTGAGRFSGDSSDATSHGFNKLEHNKAANTRLGNNPDNFTRAGRDSSGGPDTSAQGAMDEACKSIKDNDGTGTNRNGGSNSEDGLDTRMRVCLAPSSLGEAGAGVGSSASTKPASGTASGSSSTSTAPLAEASGNGRVSTSFDLLLDAVALTMTSDIDPAAMSSLPPSNAAVAVLGASGASSSGVGSATVTGLLPGAGLSLRLSPTSSLGPHMLANAPGMASGAIFLRAQPQTLAQASAPNASASIPAPVPNTAPRISRNNRVYQGKSRSQRTAKRAATDAATSLQEGEVTASRGSSDTGASINANSTTSSLSPMAL